MQHSTVLHDPVAVATPSRLNDHMLRKKRLERLASAAVPDVVLRVDPVEAPPEAERPKIGRELIEEWTERQRRERAAKEPWFSIVEEIDPKQGLRPRVADIIAVTAKHYGVSRADILSARRTAIIARPRQVVYYLSKKLTLKSLPEIARLIGNRDHTSALHGIRKIERLRKVDARLEADIVAIASRFGGEVA